MTTPAPITPPPMTPEEKAAADAALEKQLRDLASQLQRMSDLGFDPMTIRKGVIAAVADGTTPPTVSINISGDTETLVTQVRSLNNYTPLSGQTVLVAKQATEIFLLGSIAATNPYAVGGASVTDNGWTRATLTNGSHGGNGNGDVYYRRVLDHGSWKMQWRGGWAPAADTTTFMLDTANALESDYRPSSKRSVMAARETTGATALQFDFHTDGRVQMVGHLTAPLSAQTDADSSDTSAAAPVTDADSSNTSAAAPFTDSVDPVDTTTTGGSDGHTHGVVGGHYHTVQSHWHNLNGHTHTVASHWHNLNGHTHLSNVTVTRPAWVSLNGVEYFL